MGFSFEKFNKEKLFDIDTSDFEYTDLESLYKKHGEGEVYRVRGLYLGTKSLYDPETPLLATDSEYVNLPVHQLNEVKAMLGDRRAIEAINAGEAGFTIECYYQKRFKKNCYAAHWVDYNDATAQANE